MLSLLSATLGGVKVPITTGCESIRVAKKTVSTKTKTKKKTMVSSPAPRAKKTVVRATSAMKKKVVKATVGQKKTTKKSPEIQGKKQTKPAAKAGKKTAPKKKVASAPPKSLKPTKPVATASTTTKSVKSAKTLPTESKSSTVSKQAPRNTDEKKRVVVDEVKPAPKSKSKTAAKDPKSSGPKLNGTTGIANESKSAKAAPPELSGKVEVVKKPTKRDVQRNLVERMLPTGGLLSGSVRRAPLISSGPKAKKAIAEAVSDDRPVIKKSPFKKKELADFRALLLQKRQVLLGNVTNIEREALQSFGGGSSNTPQHMAEQGSDASEQSLSLDIAAHERGLIREIDEALARVEAGTYGVCVLTGRPIRIERLNELPWAKYSIEAARMLDTQRFGTR